MTGNLKIRLKHRLWACEEKVDYPVAMAYLNWLWAIFLFFVVEISIKGRELDFFGEIYDRIEGLSSLCNPISPFYS